MSHIAVTQANAVARIELNRPEVLNAWTPELGRDLGRAVTWAADAAEVRAVIVTGAGRAFSTGADLKVPRDEMPDGAPDLRTRLEQIYNPLVLNLRGCPKPVVAAVNGPAAGLGYALAVACDFILAAESAYFLLPFARLGLIPDAGATYLTAVRTGYSRALQLAMTAERLDAATAHEWGLVNEVLPDDELMARAAALAQSLAEGPTRALANMKKALNAGAQAGLAAQLDLEAGLQQEHARTADYREGVAAFREKREPHFTGR